MVHRLKNINPIFWVTIIALLVVVLLTKNWQCKPKDHSNNLQLIQEQSRIRDSARRSNEHQQHMYRQDSARWQKEKDTFKVKLATTYNLLTVSQRKSAGLSATVKISKANNDTSNYIHACDSLADENANLNYLINEYIVYSDTVSRANDSLLKVTQVRSKQIDALNGLLNEHAQTATDKYNSLYKSYEKVSKKVAKKWTVGLGAGYGIGVNGRLQPVIGVTLSRTLLKL